MTATSTAEVESESKATSRRTVKVYGRYIVADSGICHGKLTFRGTRVLVATVLEQVARGRDWETIEREWGGKVSKAAIAEAVRLANEALFKHLDDMAAGEYFLDPAAG
ncbi:MAG: DUF433 domain-containing protein [Chloroflexota bacterium]